MTNEVNRTPRAGDPSTAELEKREKGAIRCPLFHLPSSFFPAMRSFLASTQRPIARHASSPRGPARTAVGEAVEILQQAGAHGLFPAQRYQPPFGAAADGARDVQRRGQ